MLPPSTFWSSRQVKVARTVQHSTASLKSAEDKVFDPHALPLIEVEDENDTARQASEDEDGNKKRN